MKAVNARNNSNMVILSGHYSDRSSSRSSSVSPRFPNSVTRSVTSRNSFTSIKDSGMFPRQYQDLFVSARRVDNKERQNSALAVNSPGSVTMATF
jgi:hypothetical protein